MSSPGGQSQSPGTYRFVPQYSHLNVPKQYQNGIEIIPVAPPGSYYHNSQRLQRSSMSPPRQQSPPVNQYYTSQIPAVSQPQQQNMLPSFSRMFPEHAQPVVQYSPHYHQYPAMAAPYGYDHAQHPYHPQLAQAHSSPVGRSAYSPTTSYSSTQPSSNASKAPSHHTQSTEGHESTTTEVHRNYVQTEHPSRIPNFVRLEVVQQPRQARACGSGDKDRRQVDPPPVLKVHFCAEAMEGDRRPARAYILHTELMDDTGLSRIQPSRGCGNELVGSVSQQSHDFTGREGLDGLFFALSDLSVRTVGRYRLKFTFIRLPEMSQQLGFVAPPLTSTLSDVFQVYPAKDFPGMMPSTPLTRLLQENGLAISLKKGHDRERVQLGSASAAPTATTTTTTAPNPAAEQQETEAAA